MIKNFLKIAARHLLKHKGYALINFSGLAVGLACGMLILLYVLHELSWDRFHQNAARIHRLVSDSPRTGIPIAPALALEYSGIEKFVRLIQNSNQPIRIEEKKVFNATICVADSTFFEVFSFPLVQGDSRTALNDQNSVIMTQSAAVRFFGAENPLGKTVISGTAEQARAIANQLPAFFKRHTGEEWQNYRLQPLLDIHLHSGNKPFEIAPQGDIVYVTLLATVAAFILLIACINFMNLATARSAGRAKEVGVRKVLGAERRQIRWQFLGEAGIITCAAALAAVGLVALVLPEFENFTGMALAFEGMDLGRLVLGFAA